MGRMKEHPRYNVMSFRASDAELARIVAAIGEVSRQEFLLTAVMEKIVNDRQTRMDQITKP